jgi:hypothetical protein
MTVTLEPIDGNGNDLLSLEVPAVDDEKSK